MLKYEVSVFQKMSKQIVLKIKSADGVKRLNNLTTCSTFIELKNAVSRETNIPPANIVILHGFPPKKVQISDESTSLSELKISHGDCLLIEASQITNSVIIILTLFQLYILCLSTVLLLIGFVRSYCTKAVMSTLVQPVASTTDRIHIKNRIIHRSDFWFAI